MFVKGVSKTNTLVGKTERQRKSWFTVSNINVNVPADLAIYMCNQVNKHWKILL